MTKDVPYLPAHAATTPAAPNKAIRAFREDVFRQVDARLPLVDVRSPAGIHRRAAAHAQLPPGRRAARRAHRRGGQHPLGAGGQRRERASSNPRTSCAQLYQGKGVTPDKEVIAYCRIGERSSHTWFVLKYLLGYPQVKNYDGSWTEWGNLVGAPIEKGAGQ